MLLENYLQRLFPGPGACKAYMLYAILMLQINLLLAYQLFFKIFLHIKLDSFSFSFINIYYETYINK